MKDKITLGEKYGPAMFLITQEAADAYFEELVQHNQSVGPDRTREQAEQIERNNLGYYAGYYDAETRARVEKLFKCAHPVVGAIAENGQPTPEEAFNVGYQMVDKALKRTS